MIIIGAITILRQEKISGLNVESLAPPPDNKRKPRNNKNIEKIRIKYFFLVNNKLCFSSLFFDYDFSYKLFICKNLFLNLIFFLTQKNGSKMKLKYRI